MIPVKISPAIIPLKVLSTTGSPYGPHKMPMTTIARTKIKAVVPTVYSFASLKLYITNNELKAHK